MCVGDAASLVLATRFPSSAVFANSHVISCLGTAHFNACFETICRGSLQQKRLNCIATRSAVLARDVLPAPVAGTRPRSAGTVHAREQVARSKSGTAWMCWTLGCSGSLK